MFIYPKYSYRALSTMYQRMWTIMAKAIESLLLWSLHFSEGKQTINKQIGSNKYYKENSI